MVISQIPDLLEAFVEPNESEPTTFGDHIIPERFLAFFFFKDKEKKWSVVLSVAISDFGTPNLKGVEITGSTPPHPKPLTREISAKNPNPPAWTEEQLEEHRRLTPPSESVERWQLKVVEQYRFQLLELALRLAVELGNETRLLYPDGIVRRLWVSREPFTPAELKKLQRQIDKKIRQKITPDFLAEVARIYTEAGLRKENPIKAVQERFKCSYRTAQEYATKCREIKLLPETTPGKVTVRQPRNRKEKK